MRGNSKVILLVEDEVINAMAIAKDLEDSGYTVLSVTSGEEAVKTIASDSTVDLVLMDVNLLGGMDGARAAELILEIRSLPLLFISNHTHPDVVEKTENIGSYGYIVKDSGICVIDTSIKMAFKLFEEKQLVEEHKQKLETAYQELRLKNEQLSARDEKIKQAEDDLIKSGEKLSGLQDFYRNILDTILTGVWTTDKDDIITYTNKSIRNFPGFARHMVPGCRVFHDLPGTFLEVFSDYYRKAKQTLLPVYFENLTITTGNNQEYIQSGHFLPQLHKGTYSGMVCTFEDTTERVAAEEMLQESELLFRLIFENANTGISFVDTRGRYILVNTYLSHLLGGSPHDFIGKSLFDVFPEGAGLDKNIFEDIITKKEEVTIDIPLGLKSSKPLWFSSNFKPVLDKSGTLLGIQIMWVDITKNKEF